MNGVRSLRARGRELIANRMFYMVDPRCKIIEVG